MTRSTIKIEFKDYLEVMRKIQSHGVIEQGQEEAIRLMQNSLWIIKGTEKRRPSDVECANLLIKGKLN
jgi:hypothetical protein